jgi:hypothetical protein
MGGLNAVYHRDDQLSSLWIPTLLRSTHFGILLPHVDHRAALPRSNRERTLVRPAPAKGITGNLPMKISTLNVLSLSTIDGVCSSPFVLVAIS